MSVLDYSNWRPPSAAALAQHGVTGVVRYVAPQQWGWSKAITDAELLQLRAAGIQVAFNYEKDETRYKGGAVTGATDGAAIALAMSELRLGPEVPVFVSYDTDIPLAQFAVCLDYHRAIMAKNPGRAIEGYGENTLLEFLASQHVLGRGWMSESTSFPGNDAPKAHTVLQQHFGQQIPGLPGAYDMNTIVKPDWGQIPRPTTPPPVVVKVKPMHDLYKAEWVADCACPSGGAWILTTHGSIVTVGGAPFHGAFGQYTLPGETWNEIHVPDPHDPLDPKQRPADLGGGPVSYVAVQSGGQRYGL